MKQEDKEGWTEIFKLSIGILLSVCFYAGIIYTLIRAGIIRGTING